MKILVLTLAVIMCCPSAFAKLNLETISGLKSPNDPSEGSAPIETDAWAPTKETTSYPGFSDLIPYVLRSPNQLDAGSCLYMSLTGIVEFWLAKLHPTLSRDPEGPLDLSERYFMNIAGLEEANNGVKNWKTDSIEILNHAGGLPKNSKYRFTKGWSQKNSAGDYVRTAPNAIGAAYSTAVNWVNESRVVPGEALVPLPKFKRDVLFADPASDPWNVGVMPEDIIDRIKSALRGNEAPVHVIYNHYGYWHAVDIVGFDDDADTLGCSFVGKFMTEMRKKPDALRAQADRTKDPKERDRLLASATRAENVSRKVDIAFSSGGGCHPKGMFYVRDSIYTDPNAPKYDYDPSKTGEESPYSKRIVLHEYDWVRYMANHATQILLK